MDSSFRSFVFGRCDGRQNHQPEGGRQPDVIIHLGTIVCSC